MTDQHTHHTDPHNTGFFGHPRSLATLFSVEMWERFSYYGMQGILLIYLYYTADQGGLGIDKSTATGILGAYGGTVYLATILGAWTADRLFGSERTLYYSGLLIMTGHIALAILPNITGVAIGLILIALGSGGLKANVTAVVGTLYTKTDPRRDAGFSLFYLGINLGAFFGPLLTGLLQSTVGFHWGFALAAFGMAAGLTQYHIGRKHLPAQASHIANPLNPTHYTRIITITTLSIATITLLVILNIITATNLSTIVIIVGIIAAITYFIRILNDHDITPDERSRVLAFIPLFLAATAFWSLYQQQFTVVTIYSDERLNRTILGWEMPVSWIQSINPIFIIILSGIFAAMWTKLGPRQPTTPTKFALALLGIGIAFLMFLATAGGGPNSTPLLWMIAILFMFTISELCLSPVGLSVSTKLAPEKYATQMIALFYLTSSIGTAAAGTLGRLYTNVNEHTYFGLLGALSLTLGIALALAAKPILTLMKGIK